LFESETGKCTDQIDRNISKLTVVFDRVPVK